MEILEFLSLHKFILVVLALAAVNSCWLMGKFYPSYFQTLWSQLEHAHACDGYYSAVSLLHLTQMSNVATPMII